MSLIEQLFTNEQNISYCYKMRAFEYNWNDGMSVSKGRQHLGKRRKWLPALAISFRVERPVDTWLRVNENEN